VRALLLFSVILLPLSSVIFAWALRRTKITGTLTHFYAFSTSSRTMRLLVKRRIRRADPVDVSFEPRLCKVRD
jgi:hypothetical protein